MSRARDAAAEPQALLFTCRHISRHISGAMLKHYEDIHFARRRSGIGLMPAAALPPRHAEIREEDDIRRPRR